MLELQGKMNKTKVFTENIEETAIGQITQMLNEPIVEGAVIRHMPDVHAGKGAVVGTTFRYTDGINMVCPNVVGVDVGCFTGDTKVALADGRNLSFIELIDEYNMGIENFCYSQNKDGEVEINKIDIPRKIRRDNELVHITLDNGEVIKATLDHIFYDRDNHPIEAKDLYTGLELYTLMKPDNDTNHKVESVEIVSYEDGVDVYCLTNFTNHTFALSAGVFVHNCGIMMKNLGDADIDLELLDEVAREVVPTGFNVNNKVPKSVEDTIQSKLDDLLSIDNLDGKRRNRIILSAGTLGGGNHYIELAVDENGDKWLSVHTGSRGLGTFVAKHWQDVAEVNWRNTSLSEDEVNSIKKKLIDEGRQQEINSALKKAKEEKTRAISKDLAYLEGEELEGYLNDMEIAQEFAVLNRMEILRKIVDKYNEVSEGDKLETLDQFDSIHNFIDVNEGILRKGATSAREGERLVIPLNMEAGSLICIGKGNEDWNYSAPHGAGRIMSRSQAKRDINIEDYEQRMKDAGVYTTSVNLSTLDEAPDAYKDPTEIIELIEDTVDISLHLKPIWNLKDSTQSDKDERD